MGFRASRFLALAIMPLAWHAVPRAAEESAIIVRTCAPWDGAAMAVYISPKPISGAFAEPPFRSITVYREMTAVFGHKFTLTPLTTQDGIAQQCDSADRCRTAQVAIVVFAKQESDGSVMVTYRLDFGAGESVGGRVRAQLRDQRQMCG